MPEEKTRLSGRVAAALALCAALWPLSRVCAVPTDNAALAPLPVINQSLSLDQAVTLALRYNPALHEGRDELTAARARVGGAEAAGMPSVSATLFASQSSWSNILNTPDVTPPVNLMGIPPGAFLDQNVTAMVPLYTGGRVSAAVAGAKATQAASSYDLAASQQDVALQTRVAYRRALYQDMLVDAQRQNLTAAQEELALDTERYNVGKLAEFTLFRDRTLAATAGQNVTNAVRDWRQAIYSFDTILGVSLQSNITFTDQLEMAGAAPPGPPAASTPRPSAGVATPASIPTISMGPAAVAIPDAITTPADTKMPSAAGQAELSSLLQTAAQHRPEMLAAAERTAAASAALSGAQAKSQPQLNLMGMGDATHGDQNVRNGLNYTIGIAVGLPIFEGGALSSARQEARSELAKARAAEQAERLQINNDVADAWSNREAARQNLDTSQTGLAQAEEDYNVQQIRFASGKGIQLELLDALAALTTARTQFARAQFELSAADDQLLRATGTILPVNP